MKFNLNHCVKHNEIYVGGSKCPKCIEEKKINEKAVGS
jgi:hypothetical protein